MSLEKHEHGTELSQEGLQGHTSTIASVKGRQKSLLSGFCCWVDLAIGLSGSWGTPRCPYRQIMGGKAGWFPAHIHAQHTFLEQRKGSVTWRCFYIKNSLLQQENLIVQNRPGLDATPRCCCIEIFYNNSGEKARLDLIIEAN